MVISYGAHQAIVGKKQGIYECFTAPSWADIDPVFKDPDGCWYALGTFSFLLIGNKQKLAEKGWGMPMSWKELLDPKWKGQIVAPSPADIRHGLHAELLISPALRRRRRMEIPCRTG